MYTSILIFLLTIISFVGVTVLTRAVVNHIIENQQFEILPVKDGAIAYPNDKAYSVATEEYYLIH